MISAILSNMNSRLLILYSIVVNKTDVECPCVAEQLRTRSEILPVDKILKVELTFNFEAFSGVSGGKGAAQSQQTGMPSHPGRSR